MNTDDETIDEGGEAPCFAHLLDQPPVIDDALPARLVCDLAEAAAASAAGSRAGHPQRPDHRCGHQGIERCVHVIARVLLPVDVP